jgi:asparagine synthase (glutamine-hydrolysing)
MCGIAGFLEPDRGRPAQEMGRIAAAMGAALRHRGPDGAGTWVDAEAGIALAHRRLSILDLSDAGSQPMQSHCGRYVLIANGEIYNFAALRRELQRTGCVFRGHGDTEVMLAAISVWGLEAAVRSFDGMFAFALWDRRERLLHLGRDRVGEKPLYHGWSGATFLFASELKAIRRHPGFAACVDRDALELYLRYAYIPAPYSIYQGVRKVMPGSILTLQVDEPGAGHSERAYWSYKDVAQSGLDNPFEGSEADAAACLAELLEQSVKLRMQADVPVGAFFSGGYDSSLVVAMMRRATTVRVKTFTLGFEENDERPFARAVGRLLETDHTEGYVTASDALRVIPRLPTLYDEPFSDSSQIPTFLISELARRDVSVVLTGDGGDELFCGYDRYEAHYYRGEGEAKRIAEYLAGLSKWTDAGEVVMGGHHAEARVSHPAQWLRAAEFCDQAMYLDAISYLPDDLLVKVDRAAMAVGLETRVPFLDHRIIEFVWRLPLAFKAKPPERKRILRQVLYRDVPPSLVDRPKQGFSVPLKDWLLGPLRDWAGDLLNPDRLRRENFLDPAAVRQKWAQLATGRDPVKHALWAVLMFEAWLDSTREND